MGDQRIPSMKHSGGCSIIFYRASNRLNHRTWLGTGYAAALMINRLSAACHLSGQGRFFFSGDPPGVNIRAYERGMVVEAAPGAALEVVQAQFFFHLLVTLLDLPASVPEPHRPQPRGVGGRVAKRLFDRAVERLFDEQPQRRFVGAVTRGQAAPAAKQNARPWAPSCPRARSPWRGGCRRPPRAGSRAADHPGPAGGGGEAVRRRLGPVLANVALR